MRQTVGLLEKSKVYRSIFGDVIPDKHEREKWTSSEIIVKRDAPDISDPTLSAVSTGSSTILGRRADIIICDDILNQKNTRTDDQRQKVKEWFNEILRPVLVPRTGRLIVVGTAFDLQDLYHELLEDLTFDHRETMSAIIKQPDWKEGWDEYESLYRQEGKKSAHSFYNANETKLLEGAEVLWPERWPYQELVDEKLSIGSIAFDLMYQNNALASGLSPFQPKWIEDAKDPDRRLLYSYKPAISNLGQIIVAQGVDLAISEEEIADETVDLTLAKMSDGKYIILNIVSGHPTPAGTRSIIREQVENFNPGIVMVESNAYQASMAKDMKGTFIGERIKSFTTTDEKYDLFMGINSIAVAFENGKFILPFDKSDPRTITEMKKLVSELKRFPSGHTGDRLMALWFAFVAIRQIEQSMPGVKINRKVGNIRRR